MTKEEFLLDTLEYYSSDLSRRCVSEDGKCYYSPKSTVTTGNGCAIGRHLPDQLKESMDVASNGNPVTIHSLFTSGEYCNLFDEFPQELKTLGEPFLMYTQWLHDDPIYWSKDGLTDAGRTELNRMIFAYDLNPDKFKKYIN